MKIISLRFRLVFWYSAIVSGTLLTFGIAAYITVYSDLYKNLDTSLERVSHSLDYIIQKKQRETGDRDDEDVTMKYKWKLQGEE